MKGSHSMEKLDERKFSLKSEYDTLCKNVKGYSKFRYEEFVWARIAVITRIFGLTINGRETDGLVPMADMLNHKRPCETTWTYDESKKGFTITTLRNLSQEAQVYDSYGRKCNSRFFVNYGFSLEQNEDNQCRIFLKVPKEDPHYSMKERFLGSRSRRFQIPMDYKDKATRPCLSFLRFVHSTDEDVENLAASFGLNLRDIKPLSLNNEFAVLKHLAEACEEALKDFDTSLEEDNRLLNDTENALSFNIRNAILMRRGEKEVLRHWIGLYREASLLREKKWSQVEAMVGSGKMFTSRYANSYYQNILAPFFKQKEVTL